MNRQDIFDFVIKLQQAALEEGTEIKDVNFNCNVPQQPGTITDGHIRIDIRIRKNKYEGAYSALNKTGI